MPYGSKGSSAAGYRKIRDKDKKRKKKKAIVHSTMPKGYKGSGY